MRSSRLAWIAAVLTAACGEAAKPVPGPLDAVYMPTGLAVHRPAVGEARLVVASSNADLRYDDETGGAVLSIDPAGVGTTLGVNIRSFAGELAIATPAFPDPADPDPSACGTAVPGPLAITATRGSDTLNAALVEPEGLSCYRCGVPLAGSTFGDPFAVAVACRDAQRGPELRRARAFVGHLRSSLGEAWISEYTLDPDRERRVRTVTIGSGPVRSLAYDAARDRLYVLGLATGAPTPLRWIELRDCQLDLPRGAGGCSVGEALVPSPADGIELRSMALGHSSDGVRRRAFLTGRLYNTSAAAVAGGRVNDDGGVLLVVDLVENALGGVDVELAAPFQFIGRGAQDVRVLPSRGGGRGEIVAALSVDDGSVWIYDDETGSLRRFGRSDALAGAPVLGHEPFALAVDPEAAGTAHVYVGSFRESFITQLDVPLDAPDAAVIVTTATGAPRRITGRTP